MRYIDADALIEMCKRQIECEWNTIAAPNSWADAFQDFSDLVEQTPTADVAPRSEVEKLEEHIDDLNDSKEHLCVMLEEARADVAREVFEKIEGQLRGTLDHFRQNYDVRESGAIIVALSQIAELKKKYTEK